MYTYRNDNDTNKKLLSVYITVIFIMLLTNFVGNIYISVKSEKEEKIILKSLKEYENMPPDEVDEVAQREIVAIKNNAKKFLHNACLEASVAMITTMIVGFFGWLGKGIVKIAETDSGYSKYSSSIIEISIVIAILEVMGNVKEMFDNIAMYHHVMEYYCNIYRSLFGILFNIQNQIIK